MPPGGPWTRWRTHTGGHSRHLDQPQQRYWRDAHAAMTHICNVAPAVYVGYRTDLYGGEIAPGVFH